MHMHAYSDSEKKRWKILIQANSTSYPQRDGRWLAAKVAGSRQDGSFHYVDKWVGGK